MSRTYRKSLADEVYDLLRSRIVKLEMPPGFRFVERRVAQETGFGAMPVREALDRLSQEGLVRTIPRHGYQVTPVDEKYVRDFQEVWGPIVTTLHRLAVDRATEAQNDRIIAAMEAFRAVADDPTAVGPTVIEEMLAVFDLVAEGADNEHMTAIWRRLSGVCERVFNLAWRRNGSGPAKLKTDQLIIAWRARDVAAVTAIVEQELQSMRERFLEPIADHPESPASASPPSRLGSLAG